MKLSTGLVVLTLTASAGLGSIMAQSPKTIPVYPGAHLAYNVDNGEPVCCDFQVNDSLARVAAFYEKALNSKALDAKALASKYPEMKTQVEQMQKQMPSGVAIRFFVIGEIMIQGKKGAELFELVSSQGGVSFNISETKLLQKDSHFMSEWDDLKPGTHVVSNKPVDPEILASAFPVSAPSGFKSGEIVKDSSSGRSVVSLAYEKVISKGSGREDGSGTRESILLVMVEDVTGNKEYADEMLLPNKGEESFRVNGKYPGKKVIEKNGNGCVGSHLYFLVKGRYLVQVDGSYICDIGILNSFVGTMNFNALP